MSRRAVSWEQLQILAHLEVVSFPSNPSQRRLSVIIDLLMGPTTAQSSGGGGTSNDLDWNDERRRREEAQENQYVHKQFKRRR